MAAELIAWLKPFQWDTDGLPDGFEDANGNGIRDLGGPGTEDDELNAGKTDTDGDGIADGLELRIWGASICEIVAAKGVGFFDASKYEPSLALATDPRVSDTDGDHVLDGIDLNPRGPPIAALQLLNYTQLDRIDADGGGTACGTNYAPELELSVTIETAAGKASIHLPPFRNCASAKVRSATCRRISTARPLAAIRAI